MDQTDGCLKRYCKDRDSEAFSRLVTQYRPMVAAVCRRYVVEPADVEDAVQETFVKLSRRAEEITGDVGGWLLAVAGTTALDYARRSMRERVRRHRLALERQDDLPPAPSWKAVEMRLNEALEGLDPAMRSLVMARFFTGEAVKQIAMRSGVDSSTMSRRVAKAVDHVRRGLEAMGCGSMEETMLAAEAGERNGQAQEKHAAFAPPMGEGKIRVGVLVSHLTGQWRLQGGISGPIGFQPTEQYQLKTAGPFQGDRYQLISLVEPGSEECGPLEQGIRDKQIIGGMLDATDPEALKLLDVIVLGHNYALTSRVLDAVTEAVISGVGLYHEGHAGTEFPGSRDPKVCRLLLTDKMAMYHTGTEHNIPRPATVVASHPILAGVPVGTTAMVDGCGPVFVPDPGATVLVYKDEPVNPQDPPTKELNGLRMPALMVGNIGSGRVAVVAMAPTLPMQNLPGLRGKFVHNVFDWLAEARAAERRLWMGAPALATAPGGG